MIVLKWLIKLYDSKHGEGLKLLSLEQMLQRLPIALAQVKTGSTSETY